MKYRVSVRFRDGVLEPEGEAVMNSLKSMGHSFVKGVRISRTFEIETEDGDFLDRVQEFSDKLLANPVIEEFTISSENG